jgi:branched-chain amino acid transport system ATP-binding protein
MSSGSSSTDSGAYLDAEQLVGGYGGMDILKGVSLAVNRGEIVVIVGPNGAGKSTAMKAVLGLVNLKEGRVRLAGRDITALSPQARVAQGMAFVPQTQNVFSSMSVEENLEMGAYLRRDDIQATRDQVYALFPILAEKRKQAAGQLSGGQRQQVAVGRALMTEPSLLLLDEPTAGVSPKVMGELFARIQAVRDSGIAVLMVEQNARQALEIADRGYVLVTGRNAFSDSGAGLLANPEVRRAFLGG